MGIVLGILGRDACDPVAATQAEAAVLSAGPGCEPLAGYVGITGGMRVPRVGMSRTDLLLYAFWLAMMCVMIVMLLPSCIKQNTLKCYNGEIGKYDEVPCPIPSND